MTKLMRRVIFCMAFCSFNFLYAATPTQDAFRNDVIRYIRAVAEYKASQNTPPDAKKLNQTWSSQYRNMNWSITITAYSQGKLIAEKHDHQSNLANVIEKTTLAILETPSLQPIDEKMLQTLRFYVTFDYPPERYFSFIEDNNKGKEILGNRLAIRTLTTQQIKQQIKTSQGYLLGVMDPTYHGFFKNYDASTDTREPFLRTIYSASSLYTLLKLDELFPRSVLDKDIKAIADFLLSMQIPNGQFKGAFYYGFSTKTQKKQHRLVVGTASKTIFTLLKLADRFHDPRYLESAQLAGNWLLTMIKPNGNVISLVALKKGQWEYENKQSFLYTGQVLSALSRLYIKTHNQQYYTAATQIAEGMLKKVKQQHYFVSDDFRPANTISTSWVAMSFLDYYKASHNKLYYDAIQLAAKQVLARQILNKDDVYNYGRYWDTITTSGNGWINEVLSEIYLYCDHAHLAGCKPYRDAIVLTSRWLIQNSYSVENTYNVLNPAHAIGGFMRNILGEGVRTDSVCHGLNSLINLLAILGSNSQTLISLNEPPVDETMGLLRLGKGL